MSTDDQVRWNGKYTQNPQSWETADDFLEPAYVMVMEDSVPGRALDIAGGAGRHSVWLAQRGWQVTMLDISDAGVDLARKKAQAAGVEIDARVADLSGGPMEAPFGVPDLGGSYGLIVVFFFLHRTLFPAILQALKPGGHLIYKTYTIDQLQFDQGPRDAEFLLQHGELLEAFRDTQVLQYREVVTAGEKAVVEMVARKNL
ncbi:MAG TPA: class I SAM-dependent methyltransferase [Candidatus Saccharimonadales bacterium]|jgi:tellurite methyltransferase|nr:class I SAM-dependent methyltransferase [Candidatus Saccharimonadales bacterium]